MSTSARAVRDERMAQLLAQGLSQADVARRTRTSAKTVQRRCADELFMARVAEISEERSRANYARWISLEELGLDAAEKALRRDDVATQMMALRIVLPAVSRARVAFGAQGLDNRLSRLERTLARLSDDVPFPGWESDDDEES